MRNIKISGLFFALTILSTVLNLNDFWGYVIPMLLLSISILFLINWLSAKANSTKTNETYDFYKLNLKNSTESFINQNNLDKQYKFELKGLNFTKGYSLVDQQVIDVYEELRLELEPDNEYDSNAVAVYYDNEKIGYVEKTKARGAKKLVNDGFTFCYIHNIKFYYHEKSRKDLIYVDITIPYKMEV